MTKETQMRHLIVLSLASATLALASTAAADTVIYNPCNSPWAPAFCHPQNPPETCHRPGIIPGRCS